MAGPDRRSSTGLDRRASIPLRESIDRQRDHDDNNEYDLEAMGISDGFNPSNSAVGQGNMGMAPPPPRPSSTAKLPPGVDTFTLRHDGGMGADVRRMSDNAVNMNATQSRPVSTTESEAPYIRPESPYRGPTGPSHPYQMYPQESRLSRATSLATTSTSPVVERERERSYAGPSGPTHPYGMYPQSIIPEAESSQAHTIPPIPVGFPGSNNNYQRRIGPEGEEIGGIIGPDGHTEELPPYTQYPDETIARKTRPNVAVEIPNVASGPIVQVAPAAQASTSPPAMSGAGGIGLATRNPEFSSQEDLNSPSRRSILSEVSSHQVNTAAVTESEKPPLKRWQRKAKRHVWGIIPVWVFVLLAVMFILFGIILGTVLAILKPPNKHSKDKDKDGNPGTSLTTTYDATPLTSVPTNLPTLPTGTYGVPVGPPSLNQASCLANSAQSNVWSCFVGMGAGPIQMRIKTILDSPSLVDNHEILLSYANQTTRTWAYGAQAPTFSSEQVLHLVTDADETARGPAWWFQMPYNKLVIIREQELAMVQNRDNEPDRDRGREFGRKGVAVPGDDVWFCHWNGTVLEAFIYPNQTTSFGANNPDTMTTSSPSKPTAAPGGTTPSSFPTATGEPSRATESKLPFEMTPLYGKVVKIQEHRISKGPQVVPPYCVKYTINEDNSATPKLNATNQPVMIYLDELEASFFSKRESLFNHEPVSAREAGSGNKCGCVWLYT
ncbi:hypothetical protein HYALB_00001646 [Hymenoscyphus albidus]|uniref:DUF7820 domain-containing protein n=1 Tax=Hymenoscyphus albidus TaxID=595503 RepID=A0A9N9LDS5_9HELO|nr:hypothetical protein HYALB_00001646 [Hymenoscyphus albidus]